MKNKLIILLIAISISLNAQNQDFYRSQVEIGMGSSLYGTLFNYGFKQLNLDNFDVNITPVFNIAYLINNENGLSLGLTVGGQFSGVKGTVDTLGSVEFQFNRVNLGLIGRYNYLNRNGWAVYSSLRAGLTLWLLSASLSTDELQTFIEGNLGIPMLSNYINDMLQKISFDNKRGMFSTTAVQFTVLGISKSFKNIGVYSELAVGAPYYFIAGFNYRFNFK